MTRVVRTRSTARTQWLSMSLVRLTSSQKCPLRCNAVFTIPHYTLHGRGRNQKSPPFLHAGRSNMPICVPVSMCNISYYVFRSMANSLWTSTWCPSRWYTKCPASHRHPSPRPSDVNSKEESDFAEILRTWLPKVAFGNQKRTEVDTSLCICEDIFHNNFAASYSPAGFVVCAKFNHIHVRPGSHFL